MNMASSSFACFALIVTVLIKATERTGDVFKKNAFAPAARPDFPDTFQAQAEAVLKEKKIGADGAMYFDRPNNIAAKEIMRQGDSVREIYKFDTDELINIEGDAFKKNAFAPAARPNFSDTFQAKVEAIFKDKNVGADGAMYFDRPNNIAAVEIMWQGDFVREIYNFDTDELINIKGYSCSVKNIPDEPSLSFFPFTIDGETGRKNLTSPENALYFGKSTYVQDTYDDVIESYMYKGYIDVPRYDRKNCTVIHQFTKPNFETASCDSEICKPQLLTISVKCERKPYEIADIEHIYKFFHFMDTIRDESVFHPPAGVYCDRKGGKDFPSLPMYFSFSYDIDVQSIGGLQKLHKKVWYDGDMQLIRLDGFERNGFVHDIHIYDFYNGMSYVSIPELDQMDMGEMPTGLSLELITLLPKEVFPINIQASNESKSPQYAGPRTVHGLEYNVWSVIKEEEPYRVVTEMYFLADVADVDGEVQNVGYQLSFLEIYIFSADEDTDSLELSEVKFIPVNNFRSDPRDWSAFDITSWFDNDQKRSFEVTITGPKLTPGSKPYGDFLEELYLELMTTADISSIRISKLEMLPDNDTSSDNTTVFRGVILESLDKLGYDTLKNESNLDTAFLLLEDFIKIFGLKFTIDNNGETQIYVLKSFRTPEGNDKDDKNKCPAEDANKNGLSGGAVSAIAIGMLTVGAVLGIFLFSLAKTRRSNTRLIEFVMRPSRLQRN